jgi:hypothetical protein
MERTADQALAENIAAMGRELGELYSALWQEVAWIHSKWAEYVQLFGVKESRIDLLNRAAPRFARLLQDSLWEDVLLHIARLTDPAKSMGKSNLSIRALAPHVADPTVRGEIEELVSETVVRSDFCRDWRNRHLAHRDLQLALARGAEPLKAGSRSSVREVLQSLSATLNALAKHYLDSTTMFDFETCAGGALSLLHVIDDGIRADDERRARLRDGRVRPDDYRPRDI